MKLKNIILSLTTAIVALTSLSSCNTNSDSGDPMFMAIATIATINEQGTVFTMRQKGDSPLITLTSSQKLNLNTFKKGERVLIQFTTASTTTTQLASGPINLLGVGRIFGSGKQATPSTAEKTNNWSSQNFEIQALIRTGEYIDMTFVANSSLSEEQFIFYLDEATENTSSPEFHFVLKENAPITGQLGLYYASYSIANVWNNPKTDQVKIFHPAAGQLGNCTILKKNEEIQKPTKPTE